MTFDRSKFIDGFKAETREHLQALSLGLIKLEKNPGDKALLNDLMREGHTIKGSAMMMGYQRIADIGHCLEEGLERALHGKIQLNKSLFDAFFKCIDVIEPLLEDKVTWKDKGLDQPFVDDLCRQTQALYSGQDSVLSKLPSNQTPEVCKKTDEETAAVLESSIRVNLERLNRLMNLSGEIMISKIRQSELVQTLLEKINAQSDQDEIFGALARDLRVVDDTMNSLARDIQDEIMGVRMLPVSSLFNTFPRAMRDLALSKGKDVDFELRGEETVLDKTILDELKAPLMHLLRNAVDHGLETFNERVLANKPKAGKIILSAYHHASQVVIEIFDDGNGIDIEKVKQTALDKGLVTAEQLETMPEEEITQFVFNAGFSTRKDVSETSGRGVGLDVVREQAAKLKGMVDVSSKAGAGTKFTLRLPLTLAITESLLVTSGPEVFAIPIEAVVETTRIEPAAVKTVEGKEAVSVRGRVLPLLRISDLFRLPRKGIFEKKFLPLVIVQSADKRIAVLVDELIGRQKIVAKTIGDPLKKIRSIFGATILGDGRVILILDVASIIGSSEAVMVKRSTVPLQPKPAVKKKKTILLAEDVLSTAMLEKSVLESVGYSVVIARDGKEALDRAAQEKFDLVITDVLMPRMDGFELTGRLKKDSLYRDVPIIIVTTRESDEDKRRGMEAGADAYILKKDFTSEGLLETIERLVG